MTIACCETRGSIFSSEAKLFCSYVYKQTLFSVAANEMYFHNHRIGTCQEICYDSAVQVVTALLCLVFFDLKIAILCKLISCSRNISL